MEVKLYNLESIKCATVKGLCDMPIKGTALQNSTPKPKDQGPLALVYSSVCSTSDPKLVLIYFTTRSSLILNLFLWALFLKMLFFTVCGHFVFSLWFLFPFN